MTIITLLSDFGTHDASVAIAKGVLMQYIKSNTIIDISHDIAPFNLDEASYFLANTYENFPIGTVNVILMDIFYDKNPKLILSEHNGYFFVAPNNGIIPLSLGTIPTNTWLCHQLSKTETYKDWLNAIGEILNKLVITKPKALNLPECELCCIPSTINLNNNIDKVLNCKIIHIDHFGNVVLDIQKERFDTISNGRNFEIHFKHTEIITEISSIYNQVSEGDKMCRFNSNGYLEICINKGSASSLLGLKLGSSNNNIQIIFQ